MKDKEENGFIPALLKGTCPSLCSLISTGALCLTLGISSPLLADTGSINISSQALDSAIKDLGQKTGLQIIYRAEVVSGKRSAEVSGAPSSTDALEQMLRGTGLLFRITENGDGIIYAPDNSTGTLNLGETVVVDRQVSALSENTGSYNKGSVSAGSKTGQSIREIPQSVSVVTRQRIEEQGIDNLSTAMKKMTGVSVKTVPTGGDVAFGSFISRGFEIKNIQFDGGAPIEKSGATSAFGLADSVFDMAAYDSVEVLRGSDSLFAGKSKPSGIVNLVRKKPLDYNQVKFSASAGSWDNYRTEVDVTGPLTESGNLKGRFVTAYQDRNFFYDLSDSNKNTLFYGVLEADLTSETKATFGLSRTSNRGGGWWGGLPRLSTGDDVGLSRKENLATDWMDNDATVNEIFANLEHSFANDWVLKVNTTRFFEESNRYYDWLGGGGVNPETNLASYGARYFDTKHRSTMFDVNLSGGFKAFERNHKFLIGTDYSNFERQKNHIYYFDRRMVNVGGDIQDQYTKPARNHPGYDQTGNAESLGAYGSLTLEITEPLKVIAGARYNEYRQSMHNDSVDQNTGEVTFSANPKVKETGAFTPFGAISYDFSNDLTGYISAAEVYISQAGLLDASLTPLEPIEGMTYEIGLKGEALNDILTYSVAFYYAKTKNEGVFTEYFDIPDVSCCYANSGVSRSKGIDIEVSGDITPNLKLFMGYTFNINDSTDAEDGIWGVSADQPKHLLKLWSVYQFPGALSDFRLGGGANIQSSIYSAGTVRALNASGGLSNDAIPYDFTQSGYAVWDGFLEYKVNKNWLATLNVNNIFDREYYKTISNVDRGNWYGEPRNYMLTLRSTF
ncbi:MULTISPECIES: TonB-dependent siderophore receptor [unclassified Pseudomonas]|uniref:TonB-dependent siderophore receptor n=1 Tax=unclassified Pseudomonas TaxID=196821 RepID=UPI0024478508|nr:MULTISPECIES: TonB-dependent siderophore receptor [unclassified Pseudomonas]MDH0897563.1 TonB-dependent siderophore receptor [Pseudomonas sp. GD03875]MDH1067573.1 TonB-dependent siderophore receptor [Pseudomonas sp. GD03985]